MMMIRSAMCFSSEFYALNGKIHASTIPAMRMPQSHQGGSSFSSAGPPWYRTTYWSMTTWLIVLNIIIFIIDVLTYGQLTRYGALSGHGIRHVQIWQLITFQFLHAGPFHLIFN